MVYFYLNNNESLSSESNNDTYKKVSRFILENLEFLITLKVILALTDYFFYGSLYFKYFKAKI